MNSNDLNNQTSLQKNSLLLHYRIIKTLGTGGFGITYLALDTKTNEPVAIKEYFPEALTVRRSGHVKVSLLASDKQNDFSEGQRRFKREALLLGEFKHPNIAGVLGFFEANDTAYFVMKFIEGQSLADYQQKKNRALTETEIIEHCLPILHGLALVHSKKVLHLDIKPDNILQTQYGQPILIDFGGARVTSSQRSKDLSQHSSMVATDGYAPSEQYSLTAEQTPATDIYAFGMTLYHLMAPKISLAKSMDRQNEVFTDMPDPLLGIREVAEGYSEALYQTVEACIQLKQKDRPQTVAAVQAMLKPLMGPSKKTGQDNGPVGSGKTSGPKKPAVIDAPVALPWRKILAAMVILVVIIGGVKGYENYKIKENRAAVKVIAEAKRAVEAEAKRVAAASNVPGKVFNDCDNCPTMVNIAAGSFLMGSNKGRSDEKPEHWVTIKKAFAMSQYETTFAQWQACVTAGGCDHRPGDEGWGKGSRPVINVSWNDAQQYARWLSKTTGKHYRLPTEAEWEYAARAGSSSVYHFGDESSSLGQYAWFSDNAGKRTHPVAQKKPNRWGLYDMHGNVWEWVQDWYGETYYATSATNDPRGPSSGRCVFRGGSWYDSAWSLRSANRISYSPGYRSSALGFRLVRQP